MKAKKIISMMLAGVMVMGLLAGCSSNAGESGRDTEETVQSETETEAQETETQEAQKVQKKRLYRAIPRRKQKLRASFKVLPVIRRLLLIQHPTQQMSW